MERKTSQAEGARPGVRILTDDEAPAAFSLPPGVRIRRQLARLGLQEADAAEVTLTEAGLYGASVLDALATAPEGTVLRDDAGRIAGMRGDPERLGRPGDPAPDHAVSGAQLAGRYDKKLRKRTDPTVLLPRSAAEAEQALFDASYKGVTDLVTKHVWPRPALAVTRWCAARGISPNQVTWASAALVLIAFWLFWIGWFGLGLLCAYAMTFLDTVDGKLARVTLTSSRFGDALDHGIDLIHPPFWWWAWAVGCAASGDPLNDGGLALGVIVAGYVLQRGEEGLFIARFGIEMHIWKRFDSLFRQVTARRNPNLLILTAFWLAGAPREGLIAVAIWTAACLLVHAARIVQAFAASRAGPLASWLAEE
ncbi:MAG: CDP-alcohol phosphatidyltransferase family protein [Pseudomonadota bacterium]